MRPQPKLATLGDQQLLLAASAVCPSVDLSAWLASDNDKRLIATNSHEEKQLLWIRNQCLRLRVFVYLCLCHQLNSYEIVILNSSAAFNISHTVSHSSAKAFECASEWRRRCWLRAAFIDGVSMSPAHFTVDFPANKMWQPMPLYPRPRLLQRRALNLLCSANAAKECARRDVRVEICTICEFKMGEGVSERARGGRWLDILSMS